VNPDAIAGGADPADGRALRREARTRVRDRHPLVSAEDLVSAALRLPLLDVARAWVAIPNGAAPRTGVITLIAMRRRGADEPDEGVFEPRRWRDAIRRALAPRMPLGTRLVIAAPRYAGFTLRAIAEAVNGEDPTLVERAVREALRSRLAVQTRPVGVPVSGRDVGAWVRGVEGVARVTALDLLDANGKIAERIGPPRNGLPRFDEAGSSIEVRRESTR
jgi:hypothetical protein